MATHLEVEVLFPSLDIVQALLVGQIQHYYTAMALQEDRTQSGQ